MRILIVEDDVVFRRLLQRSLEKWGHLVTCASNGAMAMDLLKEEDFSMVITDWMMPEMDGIELVQHLRSRVGFTYIIILSHRSLKADMVEGLESGADDFLTKPFDRDELRARIRSGERIVNLERRLSRQNIELTTHNSRMSKDLDYAAKIQQSLLPNEVPNSDRIQFAWKYEPCEELAGDIFNVFELDTDKIGFYILDVSGHGVAAALQSVTLSRMLSPVLAKTALLKQATNRAPGYRISSPVEVINQLNRRFQIGEHNEHFFTLIYGILDMNTRELTYASAGHPSMIHLPRQSPAVDIKSASLPIGFQEDYAYIEKTIRLAPGDRLYLYSDGILEARNPDLQQFGINRLMHAIEEAGNIPLSESLEHILQSAGDWSESMWIDDDVSLLALELI